MAKNPYAGGTDEEVIRATSDLIGVLMNDTSILEGIRMHLPDLDKIRSIHDRHLSVFKDVLAGNQEKEGELQAIRGEVSIQLGLFRDTAVLVGSQDASIPQRLGIVQRKPVIRKATGSIAAPENFKIVYIDRKMVARASGVKGAKSYELWCCEGDPMTQSNWRHLVTSGQAKRIEITGLTTGKLFYFRIRAITSKGNGSWSTFVSMIVI